MYLLDCSSFIREKSISNKVFGLWKHQSFYIKMPHQKRELPVFNTVHFERNNSRFIFLLNVLIVASKLFLKCLQKDWVRVRSNIFLTWITTIKKICVNLLGNASQRLLCIGDSYLRNSGVIFPDHPLLPLSQRTMAPILRKE